MKETRLVKFDEILSKVGDFGRYQIYIYNILCLFTFVAPWHVLAVVFLSGKADHWCKIPEWESLDCEKLGFNSIHDCIVAKKEIGIPKNTSEGDVVFDQCQRYNVTGVAFSLSLDLQGREIIPCDAGWDYDSTDSSSTIDQDFNLVCGSSFLSSVSQSLFFIGTALGAVVVGFTADMVGRKKTAFVGLATACISGVIMAFSVNIWMFMIFRFVVGASIMGALTVAYVLANEFVGPSKRNFAGGLAWVYFSCGYMFLALLAYFIRKWRHLQLVISVAPITLFSFYVLLPESPRWLLSQGRVQEAAKIVRKMKRFNKIQDLVEMEDSNIRINEDVDKESFLDLLRRPRLRQYTFNIMFNLIVNTIVYYGLSLSTNTLGVNIYIAFAIAGAVEIPGNLIVIYPIERWGRRPSYMFFMFVGGIACLATIFIVSGPWKVTVAMIGKFAITASFNIIFLHACEIFPTPVRNTAFGICRLGSNLSNFLCPIILLLRDVWKPFPLTIFGTMTLLAGGLAILLPETRGKKLPETMDEGENIGWKAPPRKRSREISPSGFSDLKQQEEIFSQHDLTMTSC